jgi:drug/metabolite transporter (DMT)-like permease
MLGSAQTRVPSSLAALVFATMPLWIPAMLWIAGSGRPTQRVILGILIGFLGTLLLLYGRGDGGALAPADGGLLLGAALCWSLGTVIAARLPRPPSPVMTAGLHLTFGGAILTALGLVNGDLFAIRIGLDMTTLRALLAVLYLLVFGTLIAFAAYMWLLDHQPIVRVSTYAFINPLIAVAIGWAIEDEQIRPVTGLAMAVILVAVAVISTEGQRRKKRHRSDTAR